MNLDGNARATGDLQKQNTNAVATIIGLGVGDVTLTLDKLFPIPISPDTYIKNSVENLAIQSSAKKTRFYNLLKKASSQTFESLFWIVFVMIFQQQNKEEIKERLKQLFKENYGKFFIELSIKEKDQILPRMPLIYGHSLIKAFFDVFQSSRMTFNKNFGLKVFRLVFFQFQGIIVSDVYIQNNVQKGFSDDLFSFLGIAEVGKQKSKIYVNKDKSKKKFSQKTKQTSEDTNPVNQEIMQKMSQIEFGEEFYKEMNRIYNPKKIEKLLQKKNNLMKMHEALSKKQNDEHNDEDEDDDIDADGGSPQPLGSSINKKGLSKNQDEQELRIEDQDTVPASLQNNSKMNASRSQMMLRQSTQSQLKTLLGTSGQQGYNTQMDMYKTATSKFRSPQNSGVRSTFRLPLDEEYILNPPQTANKQKRNLYSFLDKPVNPIKRQEIFSCTKLSPFMQDLYKFEDVYSKINVKFNSTNKEIKETPRGLKTFETQQKIKIQTKQHLTKVIKQSKMNQEDPDPDEQKKRKRFLKSVTEDDPLAFTGGQQSQPNITKSNPLLKPVFNLKYQLKSKIQDPSRYIQFAKQLEERKVMKDQGGGGIVKVQQNQIANLSDNEYNQVAKNIDEEFQEYKYIAVNSKEIDETKFRLSRMNGDFGTFLVQDVYGNMNFERGRAIEMPRINTLQEYEDEKKKIKELNKVMSAGALFPGAVNNKLQTETGPGLKQNGLNLTKNQLNKTYSMMRRHIYQGTEYKDGKQINQEEKNRFYQELDKKNQAIQLSVKKASKYEL